jgi:GrpB-like predicted nucleotidyltransferase (UPF0157 family)
VSDDKPIVVPYSTAWPDHAAALILTLHEALGGLPRRIDHIGSTAIPGMAAKDVLDLQVSVADLDSAALSFDMPLGLLGFERTTYEADHIPAGQVDVSANWAKRLWSRRRHPEGDVNLHLRRVGSPNERLALLFRDWLRAHPEAIPAYASFKVALAEAVPEIGGYTEVKDPVVDLVVAVAEAWACSVNWEP